MTCTTFIRFSLFFAALTLLPAQQPQPPGRIINIPPGKGVYYDDPSGPISLPGTVILPYRRDTVRKYLSIGREKAVLEIPGATAAVSISNTKPTFYVSGYQSGTRLYLVRGIERQDYREIPMAFSADFSEWASFHPKDLTGLDIEGLTDNLISVTPRTSLTPGEYVLVTAIDSEFRAIQLGFGFSIRP